MPHPLDWLDDALDDLDRRGLRRALIARTGLDRGNKIEIAGQSLVNFGSNDYLGLASDPRIIAAVRSALYEFGWGAGASPLVAGRTDLHAKLEQELANFEGTEAALLFPTGYAANVGTIAALVGKEDAIYSDQLNHASIIDGCRLSGAKIHVYPHSYTAADQQHQLDCLLSLLRSGQHFRRRLIVTESVFSMHGTDAPLMPLAGIAQEYNAMLMVDEAHATGVFGHQGRGMCEESGIEDDVHIRVGTLSKALGGHGGFVVGSQKLINWLSNRARTYGFSTAAPAAVTAAGCAALHIARKESYRRERLREVAFEFRERLTRTGMIQPGAPNQIIPITLGDPVRTLAAAAELRSRGFFVPAIRPPSVPNGQSLLRVSLTYAHTDNQISALVAALTDLAR